MNATGQSQIDQARIEWALRLRFSPFPELSMQMIASDLNSFRIGDLWKAGRTWEIMTERDGELACNINKRCEDVSALEWEIMSDGSPEGDKHAEALRYLYDNCTVTSALEQDKTGDVNSLLFNMCQSHANFFNVHEMLMRVDDASRKQITFEFRETPVWFFESRRGYLGYLQHVFDIYGQPLKLGEWLPVIGYGYMRPCSIAYATKMFPLRDWLLCCQRYGIPLQQWITEATKGSTEWNDVLGMASTLANDGVVITNDAVEVKLIEMAQKPNLPFEPLVERVDRLYAKLFRGVDLATGSRQSSEGGGKAVGASVQQGEKEILLQGDAKRFTPYLNFRVDRPAIRYLFGTEPKAWIKIIGPNDEDTQGDLASAQFAVANGVTIGVKTFRDRFGWPEPKPGEPILVAQAPSNTGTADDLDPVGTIRRGLQKAFGGNPVSTTAQPPSVPARPEKELAPGARAGQNQGPDLNMPGGNKPLTTYTIPSGQERALSNATGQSGKLTRPAVKQFASAVGQDLSHAIDRLMQIYEITDDTLFARKLRAFYDDFPQLKADVLRDPAAAHAMEPILGAAFANGLAQEGKAIKS